MDAAFSYLATPTGDELMHAVIILMLAVAGYLTWKTHRQTRPPKD